MIALNKVNKTYKDFSLNDISLNFNEKGLYVILGKSGSGKSTLLNLISGVDINYLGDISIDNVNLKCLNQEDRSKYRLSHLGYVFQDFRLFNLLSVYDNVSFNLEAITPIPSSTKNRLIDETLNFVGLNKKKKQTINKLSGGEKQRVAIARALVTLPNYLLCDEPTGNLDDKNADVIFKLLKEYSNNHTVILVTHDIQKAKEYADTIIYLEDGKVKNIESNLRSDSKLIPHQKLRLKDKVHLPWRFRLKTGLSKIKERKVRSIFVNMITSISLLSLGISIIVSTSLHSEIINSFSRVIDKDEVIVTKNTTNPNLYTSCVATTESVVKKIVDEYDTYLYGMGAMYLNNLDDMFNDRNQVYLLKNNQKIVLPSYYLEKFNYYVWENERYIENFYPKIGNEMKLNEVVLGLTYLDMLTLCKQLQIAQSYKDLGSYLASHTVRLFIGIDNLSWGYDNDIELELISVYPSLKPEVYHTNHFFNSYILENEGHLPTTSDIESEPELPWTLKKVYALHLTETPSAFIENLQYNNDYDDILFENANNYFSELYLTDEMSDRNVVLAFTLDKNAVNISDIIAFKKITSSIDSYYFSTPSGYQMHSSGMISGFCNNIGFSFDEDKLIELGDYLSTSTDENLEEINGTALGGITHFNSNSVMFSSNLNHIEVGEVPKDYNEIVISQGLINYLGYKDNPLYEDLYYCVYSSKLNEVIINQFKVVGIINDDKNMIYHYPLFSISFFRDKLGISSFNLLPNNLVIRLKSDTDIDYLINSLSSSFKEYKFTSPLKEIGKSVDEVMNYVTTIAIMFSILSLVVSAILLALISYLNALESEKDIKLLRHIGYAHRSIKEYIVSHSMVIGLISTITSIFGLLGFEIMFSLFLGDYLGVSSLFSFNPLAFLIVILVGLVFPILISTLITNLYLKK